MRISFSGFVFVLLSAPFLLANSDSCDCPILSCDPCAKQESLSFYTEKCAGGTQLKSCARPTCVPIDPLPSHCTASVDYSSPKRTPASAAGKIEVLDKSKYKRGHVVASVKVAEGISWLYTPKGAKTKLDLGMKVHESDTLETSPKGRLQIEFDDGNQVNLTPGSKLIVSEVIQEEKSKRTVIDLIKGRVRSKVKQKYNGAASFYRVRTKGAVAGVRGTDFVVSFEKGERAITKVETLEGQVDLMSHDQKEKQSLKAGEYGSYVVAVNDSSVFDSDEITEFVARGYMTPVYKMTAQEVKKLRLETDLTAPEHKRTVAANEDASICVQPKAKFNHCAWTCQNNKSGADRCRTDLPQVNCVRRRCNANGKWSEETRLPASFFDACPAQGTRVAPCDY